MAGRPAKYPSPKAMLERIEEYFETECKPKPLLDEAGHVLTTKGGKELIEPHPPTLSGLALYLGFADRKSLYDYKKKEKFSYVIRRAIARIEEYAEQQLTIGQASGAIFWLKSHGWQEQLDTEDKKEEERDNPSLLDLGITKEEIITLAKQKA